LNHDRQQHAETRRSRRAVADLFAHMEERS
jgi:hypothetical protein